MDKILKIELATADAFDVSALPDYVEQNVSDIYTKLVANTSTISYLTKQSGIKSDQTLNIMDDTTIFGSGEACNFTPLGSTKFTQRTFKPGLIAVDKEWCNKTLIKKFMNRGVDTSADNASILFAAEIMNSTITSVATNMEKAVWQGDIAVENTNPNTNKFDGLLKILAADGALTSGGVDIEAQINNTVAQIPVEVRQNGHPIVFCSMTDFSVYSKVITAKNLFHYDPKLDGDYEMTIPGDTIKLVGVLGLEGLNKVVALNLPHSFYGYDKDGAEAQVKVGTDDKNGTTYMKMLWNSAVQVAFPEENVLNTRTV